MLFAVAVFAPLFGSAVAGLFGKAIGDRAAQAVTILCMLLASACGVAAFVQLVYQGGTPGVVSLGTWIEAGSFHVDWALRYDALSAVMVAMVTCVATLIHIYSVGYMSHDDDDLALLQLSEPVQLRHADAGDRRQPAAAVLRLGRRRADELPADRLLVRPPSGLRRRDQGVHRQPHRRPRLRARHRAGVLDLRLDRILHHLRRGRRSTRPTPTALFGHALARLRGDRRPAVHRRHGQVGAAWPARVAARRDGRPDAGLRADPCGDHGDRRRVPDGAVLAGDGLRSRRRWPSSPSSAPPPRCSPPPSAACRTTSSG